MSNRPLTKTEWLAALEELWEAAQQPRKWVGLTHEQTKDCLKAWDENDAYALCRAIEDKLKELNA